MPNSYGIIVEGEKDAAVFEAFIRKLNNPHIPIRTRLCGGIANLKKQFVTLLANLEHSLDGNVVDKAFVIRDADGRNPEQCEGELRRIVRGRRFSFPDGIYFYVVRQQMDALLLADHEAVTHVALSRGGREVGPVNEALENIVRPKERLLRTPSAARLPYTPAVCGEVAAIADLERIGYRCPSFQMFVEHVTDC